MARFSIEETTRELKYLLVQRVGVQPPAASWGIVPELPRSAFLARIAERSRFKGKLPRAIPRAPPDAHKRNPGASPPIHRPMIRPAHPAEEVEAMAPQFGFCATDAL